MLRVYDLLAAFVAGAAALALEVLAARAMAPALGSGPVTWSAVLAVALGMLATGNLLGGALGDRFAAEAIVVWSFVLGAATLIGLSRGYPSAMDWAAGQPLLAGALAAAAFTQAAPMCLLGVVSPVIVTRNPKLASRGRWAGWVLAAGSAGGIAGALATGLWLLPWLGIAKAYLAVADVLAAVALPLCSLSLWERVGVRATGAADRNKTLTLALSQREREPDSPAASSPGASSPAAWSQAAAAFVALAVLATAGWLGLSTQPDDGVESGYSRLEVRSLGDAKLLLSDGMPQTALPADLPPGEAIRRGYLLEAAMMHFPPPRTPLVIGLGAGLAPRLLATHGVECRSVEVDSEVVRLAREEFAFDGEATIADGRALLRDTREQFDLIFLDVCTSDSLPWHLFTVEALRLARERLTADGQLVIQFIGDDGPWSASLAHTVDAVFGQCVLLAPRRRVGAVGPRWLLAGRDEVRLPPEDFFLGECPWDRIAAGPPGPLLRDAHFAAERDWARAAAAWRRLYATDR